MQRQNQITQKTDLLNQKGHVDNPGYCKMNLYNYNRESITANKFRIKEWDFYQISDGRYLIQFVIANISMADAGFFTIIDMQEKKTLAMGAKPSVYTVNRLHMPRNADLPYTISREWGKIFNLKFECDDKARHITFDGYSMIPPGKKVSIDVTLSKMPDLESITIAIPFDSKDHFFYTQKQNSMPVSGSIQIGKKSINFDPDKAFGVLDWGRGVWEHDIRWVWGNGTTKLPDGKLFGFEITWGFGDDSNATETCLFYDGKAHKIGRVDIEYNPGDMMKPWRFHEENGRFEMTMVPYYNNASEMMFGPVGSNGYQVHGKWSGNATLDDGTVLEIKDMDAFCERLHNRW